MALDEGRIRKPARKLGKLIKRMPRSAGAEEIHDFRAHSRRLETVLHTLSFDTTKRGRRLNKRVAKLRKRAGKVRDFDVLTEYISDLPHHDSERQCSVRLLEYLGAEREKQANRFHKAQQRHFSSLRRALKRASKEIGRIIQPRGDGRLNGTTISAMVAASALTTLSDLRNPPRLRKTNLHEYRLKVKKMRSLLQMAERADDQPFVDRLGEVKDAIGEWHDWEVLVSIAKEVLNHEGGCRLMEELRKKAAVTYKNALALSESMRKEYLHITKLEPGRVSKPAQPSPSVLSAAAALAA